MNHQEPLLSRKEIENAFRLLGERLAKRGIVADIYVFGGAAMALAYDARRATRDIDAIFEPHGIVLEEAKKVAEILHLAPWWLNDQASSYISTKKDENSPTVFEHSGLRVSAASGEHILAMKLLAGRRRDNDDISFLIKMLGLRDVQSVLQICESVFPDEPIPARSKLMLEDILANI